MWMDEWILAVPPQLWPLYSPSEVPLRFRFFPVQNTLVVLSSSNTTESEVNIEACHEQGIPILRRKGGGGTVVLSPGCLVFTLGFFAKDLFDNKRYFHLINQAWIDALASLGVTNLNERGLSDIAIGGKKIVGTSVFRRKHLFVYQGSLLVNPDLAHIASLLKHPSKEPDYRQGRPHEAFITSLAHEGYPFTAQSLIEPLHSWFLAHISDTLREHSSHANSL